MEVAGRNLSPNEAKYPGPAADILRSLFVLRNYLVP